MSKGKFWLRGSYVVYTGTDGHYWKLPQGQFVLNCELPPQSQVKCSFLDIVTNCVRVKTGLFGAVWISGDAMITLYNMNHKKDPNLKELLSSKKSEIKSKYQDLLTNHPEFFDASEMKKESADNYAKKQKEEKKKEYTHDGNAVNISKYWDSLEQYTVDNLEDAAPQIYESCRKYLESTGLYSGGKLYEIDECIFNSKDNLSFSTFLYGESDASEITNHSESYINIQFGKYTFYESLGIKFYEKHRKYSQQKGVFGEKTVYLDSARDILYYPFCKDAYLIKHDGNTRFEEDQIIDDWEEFLKRRQSKNSFLNNNHLQLIDGFFEQLHIEMQKITKNAESIIISKNDFINELDKDNNGIIDVAEGSDDFMKLVRKIQNEVKVEDHHMQDFIKLSKYIKQSKKDIQQIFEWIKESKNAEYINDYVGVLKNQINHLESMLLHSISMVVALKENDKATFYEIHEAFDEMNVFDSQWQRDISEKLSDVSSGLSKLISSVDSMNRNITKAINELTYITDSNFKSLNSSISSELNSINSSIKFNNLLTLVQNYQSYKINKKLG